MSRRSHRRPNRGQRQLRPEQGDLGQRRPGVPNDDRPVARAADATPADASTAFPAAPPPERPPAAAMATAATAATADPARPDDARHHGDGTADASRRGEQPLPASGCTAPQLRRFIKSRAWVPMHELRRRFGINGAEDDVTPVAVDGATIYVGLPAREGRLLGELFRAGDIGYQLSLDPESPIVIGVYPMRPVPRP